jgi:major membrane immunogen (membrane-anchored lipoprotein)
MKRLLPVLLIVFMLFSLTVACSPAKEPVVEPVEEPVVEPVVEPIEEPVQEPAEEPMEMMYEDGIYFASEDAFAGNGWKYHAIITVADGKIVDAEWNGINRVPTQDKKTLSMEGNYGMVAFSDATSEWHEQAEAAEQYMLDMQSAETSEDFYIDEDGHTDAIAGVSIHVVEFFDLAEKALTSDAVPVGMYDDGYPMSSIEPDDKGWQYMSQFIVVNGTIVDANFNSQSITEVDEDGDPVDKKGLGLEYGMIENAGSEYEWFEQANMAGEFVVANQGFDVNYSDDEGHTDSIAGVTIHVNQMAELFTKAFQQ